MIKALAIRKLIKAFQSNTIDIKTTHQGIEYTSGSKKTILKKDVLAQNYFIDRDVNLNVEKLFPLGLKFFYKKTLNVSLNLYYFKAASGHDVINMAPFTDVIHKWNVPKIHFHEFRHRPQAVSFSFHQNELHLEFAHGSSVRVSKINKIKSGLILEMHSEFTPLRVGEIPKKQHKNLHIQTVSNQYSPSSLHIEVGLTDDELTLASVNDQDLSGYRMPGFRYQRVDHVKKFDNKVTINPISIDLSNATKVWENTVIDKLIQGEEGFAKIIENHPKWRIHFIKNNRPIVKAIKNRFASDKHFYLDEVFQIDDLDCMHAVPNIYAKNLPLTYEIRQVYMIPPKSIHNLVFTADEKRNTAMISLYTKKGEKKTFKALKLSYSQFHKYKLTLPEGKYHFGLIARDRFARSQLEQVTVQLSP